MQSDRVGAGFAAAAVFVALALVPGTGSVRELLFLALALGALLVTFTPMLPGLNRLPLIGAPRVHVHLSFEPTRPGGDKDLVMARFGNSFEMRVLRVGFINAGPRQVRDVLVNVLVDAAVTIDASSHTGDIKFSHGKAMPPTEIERKKGELRPMRFWADEIRIPKGARILSYRLLVADPRLGDEFLVRVQYDSDDLPGGERVHEQTVRIADRTGQL